MGGTITDHRLIINAFSHPGEDAPLWEGASVSQQTGTTGCRCSYFGY
jgi:hypothetical protein